MPTIPLPLLTLSLLLILLLKICLQRPPGFKQTAALISALLAILLLSTLRWELYSITLRHLQPAIAILLPPLTWYLFHLTAKPRSAIKHIALLFFALFLHFKLPETTDIIITLLYIGYGSALVYRARRGADDFIFSRISDTPLIARLALLAGIFFCFSGLTDMAVAIDFGLFSGRHAPVLIALSQALLFPFIGYAIIRREKIPAAPLQVTGENKDCELVERVRKVELMLFSGRLYLNPDLTLNLLARKTGIPARQISNAINQLYGCNISQWINGYRIRHAQQLLLETNSSITDIMLDSGFSTKSNFNREFMRISGVSPSKFRLNPEEASAPAAKKC